jgi:hypothetical protein
MHDKEGMQYVGEYICTWRVTFSSRALTKGPLEDDSRIVLLFSRPQQCFVIGVECESLHHDGTSYIFMSAINSVRMRARHL